MLLNTAFVLNTLAGFSFITVGLAILILRPPRAGVSGFGAYAIVAGLQQSLGNIGSALPSASILLAISAPFFAVTPIALLWGATRYTRRDPIAWTTPFALAASAGVVALLAMPGSIYAEGGRLAPLGLFLWTMPTFIALGLAIIMLVGQYQSVSSVELQRETLILIAALLPYLAYTSSSLLLYFSLVLSTGFSVYSPVVDSGYVAVFAACIVSVLWSCRSLWRSGEQTPRLLSAASLTVGLIGAGFGTLQAQLGMSMILFGGILRILAAILLGYGLMKYGLFGTDLKLKWTIDKGALVGIFGAVFFVVDQTVQFYVGALYGAAAGLAAAIALVFVLAPLRRLTRSMADRTMPNVHDTPEYVASRRLVVYRSAFESAARDGVLTEREREILATLRRELALSDDESTHIEREVLSRGPVAA